jgi:hypothetical protein
MPKHKHFIAKFTVGGGPSPLQELERILDLADSSPAREAWFGTHKPGADWGGVGICILLAAGTSEAIIAEVIDRTKEAPDEPATMELYRDRGEFVAWWHIRNPIRVKFESPHEIPGHNWHSGLGAAEVFHSQVSFTYWDFGGASFEDLTGSAVVKQGALALTLPVGAAAQDETPLVTHTGCERWSRPEFPVYGVDFSGGEEDPRCGNRKIWVANWSPGDDVILRCGWSDGGADTICRRDLPELITQGPGWWSLDFPFGIAKETARALRLSSWPEWLLWCSGAGDATALRDEARELTSRAGVAWGQRRAVDESNQTTWFPLFEQLYRQTIYGAREVLQPLYEAGVCVLPWGWTALKEPAIVVEGFPGATIRDHLLKRRVSYKGRTSAHRAAREAIIKALRSLPFAIPIPGDVAAKAVEDQDGDALDALALLLGSWISPRLSADGWKRQFARLDSCGAAVEGWFPV